MCHTRHSQLIYKPEHCNLVNKFQVGSLMFMEIDGVIYSASI